MASKRVFYGRAVSCRHMPAFLAARSEEFRAFVKAKRAEFPDFVPCPIWGGWVRIREVCDFCPSAKIEKAAGE